MSKSLSTEQAATLYGNRFLTEDAPDGPFPESGMSSLDAMRLVDEELALEGDPQRNLATFVTTWMEPEAQRIIGENLYRNFIDHAEYPISAEVEQRCIRMLADLYHAPGETTGARTQGSSEAIMLGALSLKWKWKERREAESKPVDKPNLIFGGDVHVVWEKFCRYFDVEPRIVPLQDGKYVIGPEDVEPHIDENTIGVAAVLGTTFTGHADDIVGIDKLLVDLKGDKGLDVPLHIDGASGGFVWPFLYPESKWDFRLEQVRSINVSGHKFGLVYPGVGWLDLPRKVRPGRGPRLLRELPGQDRRDLHPQLLDRRLDGPRPVLQLRPLRARGVRLHHEGDADQREVPGGEAEGERQLRADRRRRGAAAAGRLQARRRQGLRRVRPLLAALRRARLDAARLHDAPQRRRRESPAGAGQADAEPRADRPPLRPTSPPPATCSRKRAARTPPSARR